VFLNHIAAALISKPFACATLVLTAAALLPDLVWPVLLLTGVEHVGIAPGSVFDGTTM
jgi:hypothetical protein